MVGEGAVPYSPEVSVAAPEAAKETGPEAVDPVAVTEVAPESATRATLIKCSRTKELERYTYLMPSRTQTFFFKICLVGNAKISILIGKGKVYSDLWTADCMHALILA